MKEEKFDNCGDNNMKKMFVDLSLQIKVKKYKTSKYLDK